MRYHTPKNGRSVTSIKCARYFATDRGDTTGKVYMGVRGRSEEKLLYDCFTIRSLIDTIEDYLQNAAKSFAVNSNKLRLATKYHALLKLRPSRTKKTRTAVLANNLRAFATTAERISELERAKIRLKQEYETALLQLEDTELKRKAAQLSKSVNASKSHNKDIVITPPGKIAPKSPNKLQGLSHNLLQTKNEIMPPAKLAPKVLLKKEYTPIKIPEALPAAQGYILIKDVPSTKTEQKPENQGLDFLVAELERMSHIRPEDLASTYSSKRAILSGERKMPLPEPSSKSQKPEKFERDPALTALIEKARARGKRTSSFLSPDEIPYLIKDHQVHRTVLFLSTSYMFYNYPNTIYYTAYIMFSYFVYLCVSRYNKYIVWMSKDFEYAKFLSWTSEAYQRDLHRRMQARYPHKVKKPTPKSSGNKK